MPLEALKTITEAEEAARSIKAEAAAKAKQMLAEAGKAGETQLLAAREKAAAALEAERRSFVGKGEAKASEGAAALEKLKTELRRTAEKRLDDASRLIVERIVNG